MDLSALIFIALAGAWAVYLVPKALTAHTVDEETRSVEDFSDRMRVLARREAGDTGGAELVVPRRTPSAPSAPSTPSALVESSSAVESSTVSASPSMVEPAMVEPAATRRATRVAAQRRRRVLGLVLLGVAATAAGAAFGVFGWSWIAAPSALLVGWLVACRMMVRRERAVRTAQRRTLAAEAVAAEVDAVAEPGTEEFAVLAAETPAAQRGWDPVPITLPTYVEKAPAGRTVRTIDLDSTGVWSSGRNEADSQLAREAEQVEQAERAASDEQRRASGS